MFKLSALFLCLMFSMQLLASDSIQVLTFNVFAKPDPGQKKSTSQRMKKICEDIKKSNFDNLFYLS